MRTAPLTVIKAGIARLRTRGGARADTLYDLLNGYVTQQGTVVGREGTLRPAVLPATTKGLTAFADELHTFSHQVEVDMPTGYISHVITHPTDSTQLLEKIHFAEPYLGALYVVAEFANGEVFHFWLASSGEWEADTIYRAGDVVTASVDTGLLYKATRASAANPAWAARVQRALTDVVEPTVYNDYYYTVVEVEGDAPRSGSFEPTWPTEPGARVTEDETETAPAEVTPTPIESVPTVVRDRYGSSRFSNP
jgi:hypothetical protein